ncbi:methyltransferase domain-containing protein [Teredinibacter haidensis]|uniref:methyltransferase domain-containing protein n=1 Tax=Teredinibacter haidensis TaxID=2731755 RepID=UPI000948CCA5|nr:methyltransferase domain-containing protein [Teredinibacter haidensis]
MGLVWRKKLKARDYQVRNAGESIRLYTNGIFHSQWNPNAPLSGSLWDLLVIPAFLMPGNQHHKDLNCAVLGVGGGTIINQLNHFFRPETIVGIDVDPIHLSIAKHHFGVNQANVRLEKMCAKAWVGEARCKQMQFDYIVDDLFVGDNVKGESFEPVRAIVADAEWLGHLASLLKSNGMLVMNYESLSSFKQNVATKDAKIRKLFSRVFALTRPGYHNAIAVYMRSEACPRPLKRQLMSALHVSGALSGKYCDRILDFKIHEIR